MGRLLLGTGANLRVSRVAHDKHSPNSPAGYYLTRRVLFPGNHCRGQSTGCAGGTAITDAGGELGIRGGRGARCHVAYFTGHWRMDCGSLECGGLKLRVIRP